MHKYILFAPMPLPSLTPLHLRLPPHLSPVKALLYFHILLFCDLVKLSMGAQVCHQWLPQGSQ